MDQECRKGSLQQYLGYYPNPLLAALSISGSYSLHLSANGRLMLQTQTRQTIDRSIGRYYAKGWTCPSFRLFLDFSGLRSVEWPSYSPG